VKRGGGARQGWLSKWGWVAWLGAHERCLHARVSCSATRVLEESIGALKALDRTMEVTLGVLLAA
jgi:hypothetical protein